MIRRCDLVDGGDGDYDKRAKEFMYCPDCDREIGGTCGDYFMIPMNREIHCPYCGGELFLARKTVELKIIKG